MRGVALANAFQRRVAKRWNGTVSRNVRSYVKNGVVLVVFVKFPDGLELPLAAHAVQQGAEHLCLFFLAVQVLLLVVFCASMQQHVGNDVMAGLGCLAHNAVVFVQPVNYDWQRREGQGGQDHGAHFLGGVVRPGLSSELSFHGNKT